MPHEWQQIQFHIRIPVIDCSTILITHSYILNLLHKEHKNMYPQLESNGIDGYGDL